MRRKVSSGTFFLKNTGLLVVSPALSRERRESYLQEAAALRAAFDGCSGLLFRLRVWDFEVSTNLDDKKIVNLSMPWY
jgi:hypothetical protein